MSNFENLLDGINKWSPIWTSSRVEDLYCGAETHDVMIGNLTVSQLFIDKFDIWLLEETIADVLALFTEYNTIELANALCAHIVSLAEAWLKPHNDELLLEAELDVSYPDVLFTDDLIPAQVPMGRRRVTRRLLVA